MNNQISFEKLNGWHFSSLDLKIKLPRTTMVFTIKKHPETGQNKTEPTTRIEDNFIRVIRLRGRKLTLQNITEKLN